MNDTPEAVAPADPVDALKSLEAPGPGRRLLRIFLAHTLAIVALLGIWAGVDAWQHVTHLAAAALLSVLAAAFAGATTTALVHEWGHYAGTRWCDASYTVPETTGLFLFNFDYAANDVRQFVIMSYGGQAGGALALLLLWLAVPLDTAGRAMLLCSGAGYVAFTIAFEWPLIARVRASGEPLRELATITRGDIYRFEAIGAATALLLWLVLA